MTVSKDIFERLNKGRPSTEGTIKQPPRRREDPKIFLKDILANGPVPATLVEERGATHGFTKIQIRYARRQLNIISFKGPGKDSGWFWVLPHDNRGIPAQQVTPKKTKKTEIPGRSHGLMD
jgi:hypothetical protein